MGLCGEFGAVIFANCDHRMRAEASSCVCPGCGTRCQGLFKGCPDVWAARTEVAQPVSVTPKRPAPASSPGRAADAGPVASGVIDGPSAVPTVRLVAPPVRNPGAADVGADTEGGSASTPTDAPARSAPTRPESRVGRSEPALGGSDPSGSRPESGGPRPESGTARSASGSRKQRDPGVRLRAEAEAMREGLERSFETMTSRLSDRAREIDDRAAAHLQALEHERATRPGELRTSIAETVPGMVAEAVRMAIDARQPEPVSRIALAEEVRISVAGILPAMVADAVDVALEPRLINQPDESGSGSSSPDQARIAGARQRSLEKRLDGLTRRAQEIDDRVTTHLRAIDEDRTMLSDVVRRHDQLAQSVIDADATGHHERLAAWVTEVVPGMVASAVEAALEAQAATLSASFDGAARARADADAVGQSFPESAERLMEALQRRDVEIDERAAEYLRALEEERAALAALLEGGRDQLAKSVIAVLPPMVDEAVRAAMARYATERRSPMLEMASRLRADSDVMREGLQRSFEKMMESLALREQELDEGAAAHVRAVEHERGELAALRKQVADSLTDALPDIVAAAVAAADDRHRAELDEARRVIAGLRAESEAATAELREALAGMKEELAQRAEAVERQAAASERALEGLRSAMNRPGAGRNGRSGPVPSPSDLRARSSEGASPSEADASPADAGEAPAAGETSVVDETNGGRVLLGKTLLGKPTVPRARRVERRMLKIDDGDDGPWRPVDRRQAALSELLDGPER